MRILLAHPNRNDGTSFYRAIGPFSHLQKHNPNIQVTDITLLGYNISWATLIHYDVLFYQRPCIIGHLDAIRLAKMCKKPVWIDYDDDIFNLPAHNPRHELYNGLQEYAAECLKLADFITVTTQSIKDSFIERLGPDMDRIKVVPNAYDETIFSNDFEGLASREKVIFWRGGDTHDNDFKPFIDVIHEMIDKYPQYKWAFLGSAPKWITEYRMDESRLLLYPFQEIFTYFTTLMSLRPEIMIVPLVDEKFSRGRSNISWIEGTLAGAAVVCPKFPEFNRKGTLQYKNADEFRGQLESLIQYSSLRENSVKKSLEAIPALEDINRQRLEIISEIFEWILRNKLSVLPEEQPYTDKELFDSAITNCQTQETEDHVKAYHELADWLVTTFKPDSAVDFGCGTGTLIERLLHNNVVAYGLEKNAHMVDYFAKRNPVLVDYIQHTDFVESEPSLDGEFDLAIAVECFEFIDQPEDWWFKFIHDLSKKFKYFYLVFRPYRSLEDKKTGIVNIRTRGAWQELFCGNGWKLISHPGRYTGQDILFERDVTRNKDVRDIPFMAVDATKIEIVEK